MVLVFMNISAELAGKMFIGSANDSALARRDAYPKHQGDRLILSPALHGDDFVHIYCFRSILTPDSIGLANMRTRNPNVDALNAEKVKPGCHIGII